MSGVSLDGGLDAGAAATAAFVESVLAAISDGTAAAVSGTLSTLAGADALIPEGSAIVFAYDGDHVSRRLVRVERDVEALIEAWPSGAEASITVRAPTHERAAEVLAAIRADAPAPPVTEGSVAVAFWAWNEKFGAQQRRRELAAAPWEGIASNYPAATRGDLDGLMHWTTGPDFGQLLLLYGPPGTGKTHAIRALAQEWHEWCSVQYVVDPERFFGSADYMLSVLLDSQDEDDPTKRWSLVVVEDTDELIRVDGRDKSAQSMSRLLNVCDGFVGQGLRVLVLLTTNEPIEELHPAITRPGRCAARIFAGLFPHDEAKAWMAERGYRGEPKKDSTLADLYRLARHETVTAGGMAAIGLGDPVAQPRPPAAQQRDFVDAVTRF